MIQPGDRILFQGDSVTHAFRQPAERNNAFQFGNGYVFLVAARLLAARPTDGLEVLNRGVCGDGVAKLAARWETDCVALRPTVISILVGINDVLAAVNPAEFAQTYRALLQRTATALPGVRLVLCEPFALPVGLITAQHVPRLAACQQIVRDLAGESGAVFVPLQARFQHAAAITGPEYWLFDGVHATAPGFWLISQAWADAVPL